MSVLDITERLRLDATAADDLRALGRARLVSAVRVGHAAGLSQREIATAIGRSQPEVSRLLRFHGTSPLGLRLRERRRAVIAAIRDAGGRNPRVFGSVARGEDSAESDIDLLVDFPPGSIGLFELARLEEELSRILDAVVDVVPATSLRSNIRATALAEAAPL
ncbi:MAG: hypothetical protein BGO96_08835 [Micrococcales bacterium 73-15]|uniref:nucleotidyltransferase domain-containing protein n=1 Tax=Salana multivorans TaxID=120377 RepID=UPI0009607623|nr:nucleotidyltransferase domain-containing protein [Salana multivorans]OJX95705.1 MAG: hypothetical protein BGO96_08835 [Micrococcales bacterium 73-15]